MLGSLGRVSAMEGEPSWEPSEDGDSAGGLEAVLLAHRSQLLRFLVAHGAGEAAEDLLHELWLKTRGLRIGPVGQPLSYLYRAANNLMIDRFRSRQQGARREQDWSDAKVEGDGGVARHPAVERALEARETLSRATAVLDALGDRAAAVFRRHRLDGTPQREIARELGVSLSTVESDLRKAYAAMVAFRRSLDEG